MRPVVVYFDGACEPRNPGGVAAWGYVIDAVDSMVAYGYGTLGRLKVSTNNVAEYAALCRALEECLRLFILPTVVQGDSQLVVNQVTGSWRCKSGRLSNYLRRARGLFARLDEDWMSTKDIPIAWIGREKNGRADAMSRRALALDGMQKGSVAASVRVVRPEYMNRIINQEGGVTVQDSLTLHN
jgi:ribonuclease HI